MENPGYIALSRQMALARQMEVIANNLANLNTPAFKGEGMLFTEYLEQVPGTDEVSYVQDIATYRNLSAGPISNTGNPLDVAINGEGHFVVETPAGERYTRNGVFSLDPNGRIVTAQGYPVLGQGGAPLIVPPNAGEIVVAGDGSVSTDIGPLGRLEVVTFDDLDTLAPVGAGLYDAADQEPTPVAQPTVLQGAIEGSNVIGVIEMTNMIETSRSYQSTARLMEGEHDRQLRAIQNLVTQAQA
ncbi:MAG: flagellar basal-body rod protein FlgF [Kiloniellales bacterium]